MEEQVSDFLSLPGSKQHRYDTWLRAWQQQRQQYFEYAFYSAVIASLEGNLDEKLD